MNGYTLMRFLTRERIGFNVAGIDQQTRGGKPRCTRWWRIWAGGNVRVIVDHQHSVVFGAPYWQARLRVGDYGLEFHTGPSSKITARRTSRAG